MKTTTKRTTKLADIPASAFNRMAKRALGDMAYTEPQTARARIRRLDLALEDARGVAYGSVSLLLRALEIDRGRRPPARRLAKMAAESQRDLGRVIEAAQALTEASGRAGRGA